MTHNKQTVYPASAATTWPQEKPGCHAKNQVLVSHPGQESKCNEILRKLHKLDEKKCEASPIMSEDFQDVFGDVFEGPTADSDMDWEDVPTSHHHKVPEKSPKQHKTHDLKADIKAQYNAWKALTSSLVEPLLSYIARSSGNMTPHKVDIAPCSLCARMKTSRIMCFFWDHK